MRRFQIQLFRSRAVIPSTQQWTCPPLILSFNSAEWGKCPIPDGCLDAVPPPPAGSCGCLLGDYSRKPSLRSTSRLRPTFLKAGFPWNSYNLKAGRRQDDEDRWPAHSLSDASIPVMSRRSRPSPQLWVLRLCAVRVLHVTLRLPLMPLKLMPRPELLSPWSLRRWCVSLICRSDIRLRS